MLCSDPFSFTSICTVYDRKRRFWEEGNSIIFFTDVLNFILANRLSLPRLCGKVECIHLPFKGLKVWCCSFISSHLDFHCLHFSSRFSSMVSHFMSPFSIHTLPLQTADSIDIEPVVYLFTLLAFSYWYCIVFVYVLVSPTHIYMCWTCWRLATKSSERKILIVM